MKKLFFILVFAIISVQIFAEESLNDLPCYCIKLSKYIGGNDETELLEEDVKELEKKNIYYSERKNCWAEFLVPVKPVKYDGPQEKPLPLFVAKKLGLWGYAHMGNRNDAVATSYAAREAKCYTTQMGRELYSRMQSDTALARPFFNYIYERYYGSSNKQIRVNSLADMGFTYSEIDKMEEIGYAHYKVLEYKKKHPSLSREDLIKEGFEAEKALETGEVRLEDLEKNRYYTGKLEFDSCFGIENFKQYMGTCAIASQSSCNSKIVVHVSKKGEGSLDCGETDGTLEKAICKYISDYCNLSFKPAYLWFPSVKAKVRVPCSTYLSVTERRDFDRIAIVKVVFKNNRWEFTSDTQLPDDWKMDDMIESIREQLGTDKTKKTKLELRVQMIKRKVLVGYLGEFQLASLYQIVSSNDKKLQVEQYTPSYVRW